MEITHLYHSAKKEYSLLRAYENIFMRNLRLAGKGIDLGAKSADAKYYEYLDMSNVTEMEYVDNFYSGPNITKMDLEKTFPLKSNIYDFVLSINIMEHLYNFHNLLSESYRILSSGGKLHGFVPFMIRYHPDPNDYFRYTEQGLYVAMTDAGFSDIQVITVAGGPFKVAASQLANVIRLKFLRFTLLALGIGLDRLLAIKCRGNDMYALGYYFTGVKVDGDKLKKRGFK
jgi:SAM-dependent methyltransferase